MKRVLFVCSGNTCRSPMAVAIAQHYYCKESGGLMITSAGTTAETDACITPNAAIALQKMGISFNHKSRRLTVLDILDAHFVFAMEHKHLEEINSLMQTSNQTSNTKIALLDRLHEITDPLGKHLLDYQQTAKRLDDLIRSDLGDFVNSIGLRPRTIRRKTETSLPKSGY